MGERRVVEVGGEGGGMAMEEEEEGVVVVVVIEGEGGDIMGRFCSSRTNNGFVWAAVNNADLDNTCCQMTCLKLSFLKFKLKNFLSPKKFYIDTFGLCVPCPLGTAAIALKKVISYGDEAIFSQLVDNILFRLGMHLTTTVS